MIALLRRPRAHRAPSRLLQAPALGALLGAAIAAPALPAPQGSGDTTVVAWNDLGMHCIDPDFSVFAILPPFNNVNAQVVRGGQLVTSAAGITLTYESAADPSGSINTTSVGKTDFWEHVDELFGVALPPDTGLTGNTMPGALNVPQPLHFDPTWSWFQAEGLPFTPFDDAGAENPYPLVRIRAWSAGGVELGSTVTVVPNSQELHCGRCHASGASPDARPAAGWAFDAEPARDDRWNILRLHDERHLGDAAFATALAGAGYDAAGLEATARAGTAILCARCHPSNALPGTGLPGIGAMTKVVHGLHAGVRDESGARLDDVANRTSCYLCHPGPETKCLRGAMGTAIGADGEHAMDCQSCHGDLTAVAAPERVGWLDQPTCQSCHTGDALVNSGAIRFTSVFDETGARRVAASDRFATTPDVPAAGFSLYRFSTGHGGLQCAACHGSPHAVYPTSPGNDELQTAALQGHAGTLMECGACHAQLEDSQVDGPHGMHPTTAKWVRDQHKDRAEHGGLDGCRACHGADLRGTVLSRAQAERTYATEFGTRTLFRGQEVGCWTCHDGPDDDDANGNHAPQVADLAGATPADAPLVFPLAATDPDGDATSLRIVAQPALGSVAFDGATAVYLPEPGGAGTATFRYAAADGDVEAAATVSVTVTEPLCGLREPYGFGSAGAGGVVPTLALEGCVSGGETITLRLADGLGGAPGFVLVGRVPAVRELWPGSVLRVEPLLRVLPVTLDGAGTAQVALPLPAGLPATTLAFQAAVRDPGAAGGGGVAFSSALLVTTP